MNRSNACHESQGGLEFSRFEAPMPCGRRAKNENNPGCWILKSPKALKRVERKLSKLLSVWGDG